MTSQRDELRARAASSDALLWAGVGRGDADAFEQVYRTHVSAVSRYLARRVPAGEVDDIVAAVFLEAWRQRDRVVVDPSKGLLPWLLGVARNLCRAYYREVNAAPMPSEAVADERARPVHDVSPAMGDAAVLLEQRQEHARQVAFARAALASLSDDDQLMIDLVVVEGRSPAEAARLLGINPVAARSRLHRSRRRLAAAFATRLASDRSEYGTTASTKGRRTQ